ncbi:TonB-dependent receptor, partial [Lysobacter maris]
HGERPHSDARRTQVGAVLEWQPHPDQLVRIAAQSLVQPDTDDPLGLDREAWRRDRHGTDPAALRWNTRKRIDNHQLGLRWQHDAADGDQSWIGVHAIQRDIVQVLAIPEGAQAAPGSGGGVIDVARRSHGMEAGHRWQWRTASLALGVEAAWLDEARKGYENFAAGPDGNPVPGVRGRLRRDEDNRVRTRDAYLVGDWRFAGPWTALAGVRASRVAFASDDRYIVAGNGDDSGRLDYDEQAVSLGVARRFGDDRTGGELFASVGRGFETPTVTELAYRSDGGAGFNTGLVPAHFGSGEVGLRWRGPAMRGSLALYRIEGRDEIVPALSQGGRTRYANAGRTRRMGVELGLDGDIGAGWSYALAANWIDARFVHAFGYRVVRNGVAETRTVADGNRLPGVARASGFAELAWRSDDDRFGAAVETRLASSVPVDDINSDAAPGHARVALRLDWRHAGSGWHGFARIDNLFDRDFAGSVIVNEGNRRFFEPALGRTVTLGFGWRARPQERR